MSIPVVSFIIIEYFSLEEISLCISNIANRLESIDHEIIVSSNSCYNKEKQETLKDNYPDIIWSFNDKNDGFAYGMNQGLAKAHGQYLVIANPDIEILNGFSAMLGFMDDHPEAGAIGPQMIDAEGNIQDNCRPYVSIQSFLIRHIRRFIYNEAVILEKGFNYSKIQTVDWLAGAFILIRRSAYTATKGLDNNYFMYAEDMDWCTRIRQCGYEIVYFPRMKILYSGTRSARKIRYFQRIFVKSHFKYWSKFGFFYGYPKRMKVIYD